MPNDTDDPPPVPNGTIPLRDYVEAIFKEHARAIRVASEEREKAAQALRTELSRAIEDGDRALRDHIQAQISQIQAALRSAELLEVERIKSLEERLGSMAGLANERLEGLQHQTDIIHEASERAIAKAEAATEKRFESVNEWRDQSADRERSYQEQAATLASEFPRREVVEAQFNELRTKVDELTRRMDQTLS